MSRDYRPFLADIRHACEKVVRYTAGFTFEQFIIVQNKVPELLKQLRQAPSAASPDTNSPEPR